MENTKEMKVGTKFKYDNENWICVSNDGFVFQADNLNKDSNRPSFMFIGMSADVVLI